MSLESGINQICMSNSQIAHVMKKYVPEKLMNCVNLPPGYEKNVLNAEEMVQLMLSNSDNMLRMYGTARELLLNLQKFQTFTLSHRHFGFDPKEPYNANPIVYKNMDGNTFLNKADAISLFHNIVDKSLLDTPNSFKFFRSMQSILLKYHEEKIKGVCEFNKFDEDQWNGIRSRFYQVYESLAQFSCVFSHKWKYEDALAFGTALIPVWKEQEYCEFEKELKTFFHSSSGSYTNVNVAITSFANYMKTFIEIYPGKFLPYDKKTNPNSPIVVRVFASHGVQFVMKSELFNAINITNPNSKRLECNDISGKLLAKFWQRKIIRSVRMSYFRRSLIFRIN
ncbi:hypothetical protein B9Z55_009059 [Caenorhabditis nigoni]|nr:hypothetical protein B9Z55_009059 [Caenorhabditis nigoni]